MLHDLELNGGHRGLLQDDPLDRWEIMKSQACVSLKDILVQLIMGRDFKVKKISHKVDIHKTAKSPHSALKQEEVKITLRIKELEQLIELGKNKCKPFNVLALNFHYYGTVNANKIKHSDVKTIEQMRTYIMWELIKAFDIKLYYDTQPDDLPTNVSIDLTCPFLYRIWNENKFMMDTYAIVGTESMFTNISYQKKCITVFFDKTVTVDRFEDAMIDFIKCFRLRVLMLLYCLRIPRIMNKDLIPIIRDYYIHNFLDDFHIIR